MEYGFIDYQNFDIRYDDEAEVLKILYAKIKDGTANTSLHAEYEEPQIIVMPYSANLVKHVLRCLFTYQKLHEGMTYDDAVREATEQVYGADVAERHYPEAVAEVKNG